MAQGRLGFLGKYGEGFCPMVSDRDVGVAVSRCLLDRSLTSGAYTLSDPENWTWNEFLIYFSSVLGIQVKNITQARLIIEMYINTPIIAVLRSTPFRVFLPDVISPAFVHMMRDSIPIDRQSGDRILDHWTDRKSGLLAVATKL